MQETNLAPINTLDSQVPAFTRVKDTLVDLFSIIAEDVRTQRKGLMAPGLWVLVLHRCDEACRRIPWKPLRYLMVLPFFILQRLIEIPIGIELGRYSRIGRRLRIEHWGGIVVHGHAVIGDDCLIRHGVTLGNRGTDNLSAPILGDRVDIGAGAKILGSIVIGNDVNIGANAVVIKDVPSGATAVGVPARILGKKKSGQTSA